MNLSRGLVQEIGASDNMGNTLVKVIYDHGQLIGKKTVFPENYEVATAEWQIVSMGALNYITETDQAVFTTGSDRTVI